MPSHMCMAQNKTIFHVLHLSVGRQNKNLKLLGILLVAYTYNYTYNFYC